MDSETDPESRVSRTLTALADPDCRAILEATTSTPRTVQELVERCGVPTATAYRKVDELVELGLLTDQVRMRTEGRNASEYRLRVEGIEIAFRDDVDPAVAVSVVEGDDAELGGTSPVEAPILAEVDGRDD